MGPVDAGDTREAGRAEVLQPDRINPRGHAGDVLAVAFSPDGKTIVTAGSDKLAKVWDVATGSVRADLSGHEGKVLSAAVSPDGEILATAGEDRTIRLWSMADGARLGILAGHSGAVEALAFAPDGKTLASGSVDTTIRLWDIAARRVARTIEGHEAAVQGLAFAPDGKSLASASRDRTIKLWDSATGKETKTLGAHEAAAWCVAFAPDGKSLASGGLDKLVRFWRVDQPERPQQQFGPQEKQQPALPLGREVLAITFAPDGKTLAAALADAEPKRPVPGLVAIIDTRTRAVQAQLRGHLDAVRAVAYAPDGKTLASGGGDRSVRLWDTPAGTPAPTWLGPWPQGPRQDRLMTHLDPVAAAAFTADGKTIVTATGSSIISLWDASTHELLRLVRDPSGAVLRTGAQSRRTDSRHRW